MIEEYKFGRIKINGRIFTRDILIKPDLTIITQWRRQSGHSVTPDDLDALLLAPLPEIIVLGQGDPGMMKASPALEDHLERLGIRLIQEKSLRAAEIVNNLVSADQTFAAGFHLTC